MSGIPLSHKHAVNPSLDICFFCKKAKGVVLFGALNRRKMEQTFGKKFTKEHLKHTDEYDSEAPREVVLDIEPCKDCPVFYPHAERGCFIVQAEEREVEVRENGRRVLKRVPAPTGPFVVLRDDAVRRLFVPDELAKQVLKYRVAYMDLDAWTRLGLDHVQAEAELEP